MRAGVRAGLATASGAPDVLIDVPTVHFVAGFGWGALTGVLAGAWWLLSMLRSAPDAEKGPKA